MNGPAQIAGFENVHNVLMEPRHQDITGLLRQWSDGDSSAFDMLMPLVYDHLRRIAHGLARLESNGGGAGGLMQGTALVHELYLKLVDQNRAQWRDREQFFGIAIRIMRRIIVDEARLRVASKRGAGAVHVPVNEALDAPFVSSRTAIAVDEALTRFAEVDPLRGRIVEMRYFGGMDLDEIADLLEVSRTTVKRHWTVARMWLHRELAADHRLAP